MTASVELHRVSKRFGQTRALSQLSLRVERGELLALLGPNGAGKTTALNLMLGLRPPDEGQVRVMGGNPRDTPVRAHLGAMLQESDLPATLRVRELIELFSSLYGRPLDVRRVLELADLGEQARQQSGTLSGGQRRRLIFALAICGDPDLLFLDEPTSAMDPQSRAAFWQAIGAMQARGKTIVLTTHHLEEAERVADRVAVIDHGQLIAEGSPQAIKARIDTAKVQFRSPLGLRELWALPGVTHAELGASGSATLHTRTPEALLAQVFGQAGHISDLSVTRASLEEAFLSLTGHPSVRA